MNRRALLLASAASAALSAMAGAQPAKRFRVACLWANNPESVRSLEAAFVSGLRDLGYVAGRNLVLDHRYAMGDNRAIATLADELIALRPDVMIGIESVAAVMRSKTTSIPIVLIASPDPVAAGLVQSLGRPGTNVTGLAYRFEELVAKHIDLLTELAPRTSHIALVNYAALADDPGAQYVARTEHAARAASKLKGLNLSVVRVRDAASVRQAFLQVEAQGVQAIVVAATAATYRLRDDITREARRLRLPSITSLPAEWAEAGGLMTYGPDWNKTYRRAAFYADRILKGANPAEVPIEQPSFEVVINLRTARDIGVAMPHTILLRADRVIQ
jgi:putative ABC transport system substrate-binding protein